MSCLPIFQERTTAGYPALEQGHDRLCSHWLIKRESLSPAINKILVTRQVRIGEDENLHI